LNPLDLVSAWIDAGISFVQVRAKTLSDLETWNFAESVRKVTCDDGIILTINGRLDIALGLDFEGVHFPSKGLPIQKVREKYPQLVLVSSCHNGEDIKASGAADAITLSPVFNTLSKHDDRRTPLSLEHFDALQKTFEGTCYALGGIEEDKLGLLGQRSIASLGYLCCEKAYEHASVLIQR